MRSITEACAEVDRLTEGYGIDVLMGILIKTSQGDALDQQLHMSIAINLIDVTASGITGITGRISKQATIFCCSASLIGALLGVASLGKGPLSRKAGAVNYCQDDRNGSSPYVATQHAEKN